MEQPPFVDEFEDLEELEAEAAANRRQFMMLVVGMGGILGVALIVLIFVLLSRNGTKSDIELTNDAVLKTNAAIEDAVEATGTAEVVQVTQQAVAMVATQQAQSEKDATATALAIAAATATAEAQPTPTQTSTATPVVPTATPDEGTPSEAGDGTAVAQGAATRTPTRTPAGATTTPDTGVGGLGVLLIAGVLVVVVFVARRLRVAT